MATVNDVFNKLREVENRVKALKTSLDSAHAKLDKLLAPPAPTEPAPLPVAVLRVKAEKADGSTEVVDAYKLLGELAVAGGEVTLGVAPSP